MPLDYAFREGLCQSHRAMIHPFVRFMLPALSARVSARSISYRLVFYRVTHACKGYTSLYVCPPKREREREREGGREEKGA